ncbi:unnamed protein product [Calypogeia fissa]
MCRFCSRKNSGELVETGEPKKVGRRMEDEHELLLEVMARARALADWRIGERADGEAVGWNWRLAMATGD